MANEKKTAGTKRFKTLIEAIKHSRNKVIVPLNGDSFFVVNTNSERELRELINKAYRVYANKKYSSIDNLELLKLDNIRWYSNEKLFKKYDDFQKKKSAPRKVKA